MPVYPPARPICSSVEWFRVRNNRLWPACAHVDCVLQIKPSARHEIGWSIRGPTEMAQASHQPQDSPFLFDLCLQHGNFSLPMIGSSVDSLVDLKNQMKTADGIGKPFKAAESLRPERLKESEDLGRRLTGAIVRSSQGADELAPRLPRQWTA